jgi:hypothetical protein
MSGNKRLVDVTVRLEVETDEADPLKLVRNWVEDGLGCEGRCAWPWFHETLYGTIEILKIKVDE